MVGHGSVRRVVGTASAAFTNLSLARKLLLAYLLVLAVPVAIGAILVLRGIRIAIETELVATNRKEIETIAAVVARNSEILTNASQTVIGTAPLNTMLGSPGPFEVAELLDFRRNVLDGIDNIKYINVDITSLRIYHPNGALPEMYPSLYHEQSVRREAWYTGVIARAGRLYWRYNVLEEGGSGPARTDEPLVALSRQLRLHTRHLGVVEVTMLSRTYFGPLFGSQPGSDVFTCAAHQGRLYHDAALPIPADYLTDETDLVRRMAALQHDGRVDAVTRIGSVDVAVSGEYVRSADLWLYRIQGLTSLRRRVGSVAAIVLSAAFGLIALLGAVTYLITRALTARLALVVQTVRQLHAGAISPALAVYGEDEVGILAHHIRNMMERTESLILSLVRKETAAREAEIAALHAQIDSHFIHNVLETIKMMAVESGELAISDSLTALGRLMRYSMNRERKYVWIQEEIGYVSAYVRLLSMRYGTRIKLSVDCPPHLEELELPKMVLQPIVENAIRHGIEPVGAGRVGITVRSSNSDVVIEISDDGRGIPAGRLEEVRAGLSGVPAAEPDCGPRIGLRNVHERIRLHFGPDYGVDIDSTEGVGTVVRVRIPLFCGERGGAP